MCSTLTNEKIEKFSNSDYTNTTMLASSTFDKILQEIRSSNLNFQLQVSPFSAQISLKKSLVKDRNGVLLLPPRISSDPCKDSQLEECEARANKAERELETIRRNYKQVIDDREEAYQKIKTLENLMNKPIKSEFGPEAFEGLVTKVSSLENENNTLKEKIAAQNDDIEDLRKSVEVKIKVSERLKKELRENRTKVKKEKAAMLKAHKTEVKSWRKDLGEETKKRIKLEKQLEKNLNDSVCDSVAMKPSPILEFPCSQSKKLCKSCGLKNQTYPSIFPSMVSHCNPCLDVTVQCPYSVPSMITHCIVPPSPEEVKLFSKADFLQLWAEHREQVKKDWAEIFSKIDNLVI